MPCGGDDNNHFALQEICVPLLKGFSLVGVTPELSQRSEHHPKENKLEMIRSLN